MSLAFGEGGRFAVVNVGSGAPSPDNFADLMRQTRLSRRLTQQEVGDRIGVTAITVSRWESGRFGKIQARLRPQVATFLGLSVRDLYRILGLQVPTSKVVTMFGDAVSPPTSAQVPGAVSEAVPANRVGPTGRIVISAIAARIGTGVQLSDEEMRFHEHLLAAARLADASERVDQ